MSEAPVLVLQMQRLGDLVLTFPLLGWLGRLFPGHPLWVVGEERFFRELMPLSPKATYFPYSAAPALQKKSYRAVINLSHREEAARLAGSLKTELLLGPHVIPSGGRYIAGEWQLYRTALTHNNRHNLFHWTDLYALDIVPSSLLGATRWPAPRPPRPADPGHIGLFLGASEADKRPGAPFWTDLARALLHSGYRPVLLGGEAEKETGAAVASALGAPSLNLCGRFSVSELARFIAELGLLVTPDTGPMHVAVWTETPVLNLSMGPVNAWETGPFSPGHLVARSRLSCVGCWRCSQSRVFCKERFSPISLVPLIRKFLAGGLPELAGASLPGGELLRSERKRHGLYALFPVSPARDGKNAPRFALSLFWQAYFGHALHFLPREEAQEAWSAFASASPGLVPPLRAGTAAAIRHLAAGVRRSAGAGGGALADRDFWEHFPPLVRPLSGYLHMLLQNGDFSRPAFARALEMTESLTSLLHS